MKSFYNWCVENDRMDLIDLWSKYKWQNTSQFVYFKNN